uniref:Uncharacterized protein n=1 Tax=Arundo donax TaxID=35708 RepID=A0A0A9GY50_ARUDO
MCILNMSLCFENEPLLKKHSCDACCPRFAGLEGECLKLLCEPPGVRGVSGLEGECLKLLCEPSGVRGVSGFKGECLKLLC